jgi:hypothetical protein
MPVTVQIASVVADERFRRPASGTPTAEQVLNTVWKDNGVECEGMFPSVSFWDHDMRAALGLTIPRIATVFIRICQGLLSKL